MKKKKQQTRNLIVLAVLIVGIILGLWAMNSNFSLNSKASEKCPGGTFSIGPDNNCYELAARSYGSGCRNKRVAFQKCRNAKYFLENKKIRRDGPITKPTNVPTDIPKVEKNYIQ